MTKLFNPLRVGRMELSNRIAMAPMTRLRADDQHAPLPIVKDHYAQRASVPGTLIITEATSISLRGGNYPNTPGIYNDAQIAAWKEVTSAVHAKGSYIYLQLWALGRVGIPDLLKAEGGFDLVSSSAVPANADGPVPRALTESEIEAFIGEYAQAARNAVAAGFDGVEIHAANGYLIDQFIQDVTNKRTDRWGGSVENRSRFAVEITRAVVDAIGADRTGIRFSPFSSFQGMKMEDPLPQFTHLAQALRPFKLAYAHLVEPRASGFDIIETDETLNFFFEAYEDAGPIVVAGGYTPDSAREAVDVTYQNHEVVVAFGRPFTSNPDLLFRLKENVELTPYQRDVLYIPKEPKGYVDFGFSAEFQAATAAA
ncbi:uncharacterized protein N7459_008805 [Penicillium hispanicum]|uniref:uncharacterized protein n=1 Tax=Penicillium hispanicum TaxID=1080232 RepID=UPI002541E92A|nr:uncharacterized protein N7459_008805 [Penicillium hispanicum]KAJ5574378.1 hypothetical protein N7459_008805 [Penicillium hispanicum]